VNIFSDSLIEFARDAVVRGGPGGGPCRSGRRAVEAWLYAANRGPKAARSFSNAPAARNPLPERTSDSAPSSTCCSTRSTTCSLRSVAPTTAMAESGVDVADIGELHGLLDARLGGPPARCLMPEEQFRLGGGRGPFDGSGSDSACSERSPTLNIGVRARRARNWRQGVGPWAPFHSAHGHVIPAQHSLSNTSTAACITDLEFIIAILPEPSQGRVITTVVTAIPEL
jgi:hypothetical protein